MSKFIHFDVMIGVRNTSNMQFVAAIHVKRISLPWTFVGDHIEYLCTQEVIEKIVYKRYPQLHKTKWYVEFYN